MNPPLAVAVRPQTLDEVCGQQHILGKDKVFRKMLSAGFIPNMVFYGPSGVGKTTVARIIAANCGMTLHCLNGTSASTGDIKKVIADVGTFSGLHGILLYLDEIQYFNKKQQQSLLECIEDGSITLIASTTENPYFYVYNALLSRCTVFEFKPLSAADVEFALERALAYLAANGSELLLDDEGKKYLSAVCGGDVRKALNALDLMADAYGGSGTGVGAEQVKQVTSRSSARYDRADDSHYDLLSALQKSIRGSDENAALHYLARLLDAGDIISPCRRLLVIASEDIGLAYPQAVAIVKACVDSAMQLGLPEARIPLGEAAVLLATAPKSNSAIMAIDAALADVRSGNFSDVPDHLKGTGYGGAAKLGRGLTYKYPHEFPNRWVEQQYLPDSLLGAKYYEYADNKLEQAAKLYWQKIKGKDNG